MEKAVGELEAEVQQVWGVDMKIKEGSESEVDSSEPSNQEESGANDSGLKREASHETIHLDVEQSARVKDIAAPPDSVPARESAVGESTRTVPVPGTKDDLRAMIEAHIRAGFKDRT